MPRLLESWGPGPFGADQLAVFFEPGRDPWDRIPLACGPNTFGAGSTRCFTEYFQGTSRVTVRSLDEVATWLQACECLTDRALFSLDDHWLHPLTFEELRKGDCEDHALWAWRKLAEIGHPARFAAGRWNGVAHAWVLLDGPEGVRLFETTAKASPMIHPLDAAIRTAYCPALSIDHGMRTFVHAGYPRFHSDA